MAAVPEHVIVAFDEAYIEFAGEQVIQHNLGIVELLDFCYTRLTGLQDVVKHTAGKFACAFTHQIFQLVHFSLRGGIFFKPEQTAYTGGRVLVITAVHADESSQTRKQV
jgi:hypothetical protein